ncbi:helix-turn-helix domain-containing protein [Alteribacter lacisalsi]|uniref:helix-turn-helix domain-containing protein n=1 Tax=Alteribacter lacisalsi TaxID=2045244 RepID=UPI00137503C6|nr:helix-turn-helix transcriptional regulator [Alteribacter lacisalsi]
MKELGERIKKLRIKKGYSLRGLGDRIDTSFTHISRIESGQKTPNLSFLYKLSEALNVPMNYFFQEEWEEEEFENINESELLRKALEKLEENIKEIGEDMREEFNSVNNRLDKIEQSDKLKDLKTKP